MRSSFGRTGIDHRFHFEDLVRREPALFGVAADQVLARGDVDAEELVAGDVALQPLDPRAELAEDIAALLGDPAELRGGELAGSGQLAFDHEFGHLRSSVTFNLADGPRGEP